MLDGQVLVSTDANKLTVKQAEAVSLARLSCTASQQADAGGVIVKGGKALDEAGGENV